MYYLRKNTLPTKSAKWMSDKERRIVKYYEKMQALLDMPDRNDASIDADNLLCELLEEIGYSAVTQVYRQVKEC